MITSTTANPIVFKQDITPATPWLQYGLVMAILLIFIVVLTRQYKSKTLRHAGCQLIEKKSLGNKTIIYVVEYQKQRFLLADNQHALAIHPVDFAEVDQAPSSIVDTRPSLGVELNPHEVLHAQR